MEVVSKQSSAAMQFGTSAEPLPNWGLPFCMELRYVFETLNKRYYVLDPAGEANLADLMKDGLPEPTVGIFTYHAAAMRGGGGGGGGGDSCCKCNMVTLFPYANLVILLKDESLCDVLKG
jgi:hypothetical protein